MSEEKPRTIDQLARLYKKIANARAAATKVYEQQDEEFKQQLATLDTALLAKLGTSRSVRTEDGLNVIKILDVQPNVTDWDVLYDWIIENNTFEVLERRVKKTFIKEFRERRKEERKQDENDDGPLDPPGVKVIEQYKIQVRKG